MCEPGLIFWLVVADLFNGLPPLQSEVAQANDWSGTHQVSDPKAPIPHANWTTTI